MATTVKFHPAAIEEANAAYQWYSTRSDEAGKAFISELDLAITQITESPERWPVYEHGTRRYVMHRFPFLVVYRIQENSIEIIAIAHGRRRPRYWQQRYQ